MQWLSLAVFEPALPDQCFPENDFLLRFSSAFHTCVPTPLAFTSNLLGALSILAWLFAQLPQIYKNWNLQSTSGLSIFFLVEWCLGDLSNLLGALFTHQASWQVAIGSYYVFVDLCLVGQWVWFEKLKHGHPVFRIWRRGGQNRGDDNDDAASGIMEQVEHEGMNGWRRNQGSSDGIEGDNTRRPQTRPKVIFRSPTFQKPRDEKDEKTSTSLAGTPNGTTMRLGTSSNSPFPSPSPRTMLLIACVVAMAHASPISRQPDPANTFDQSPTSLEQAGTILSWMSTVLYLGSRLPQLIKNWRRKSTAGLSPQLFLAAFCGNLFYSSALLTNPCAWSDFGPYGGGGWVGPEGNDRAKWVLAALPFFLGAFGVLGLDASVGVQFLAYGEPAERLVVVDQEIAGRGLHWRRVSGWLRGWTPSISESKGSGEREALLRDDEHGIRQGNAGYGAL